jgi:three-Cys-motif partner protein
VGGAGHGLEALQVQLHMVDDNSDTLLEMQEHTRAKHAILEEYLKAWFPIISNSQFVNKLVYIDGFAGPGEYKTGEPGSPIIALNTALSHIFKDRFKKIYFIFIEERNDRCLHLNKKIKSLGKLPDNFEVTVIEQKFERVMGKVLSEIEIKNSSLAPTFAFIDPFGYSDTGGPKIMGQILKHEKCEVLLTYMVGFMDKGAFDPEHCKIICREWGFSENEIESILKLPDMISRERAWITVLKTKLIQESAKGIFHLAFCLKGYHNRTLYYLVYFTKHKKGIEVMKNAMFNLGRVGTYTFSDHNFQQTGLTDFSSDLWKKQASRDLYDHFKGTEQKVTDVKDWILLETLFKWSSDILITLEDDNKINYLGTRARRHAYPDGGHIKFL